MEVNGTGSMLAGRNYSGVGGRFWWEAGCGSFVFLELPCRGFISLADVAGVPARSRDCRSVPRARTSGHGMFSDLRRAIRRRMTRRLWRTGRGQERPGAPPTGGPMSDLWGARRDVSSRPKETHCNIVLRLQQCAGWREEADMAIEIEGVRYYSATDVHEELGIARQTLWRWRKASKIPGGRRYRGYQVVFTAEEMAQIREFANRLEPPAEVAVRRRPRKGRS